MSGSQASSRLTFRRSSRCNASVNCVDVAFANNVIMRDVHGTLLVITRASWSKLIDGVKNGDFDL